MENAGRAPWPMRPARLPGRRVVVVAGPGNNGGDGFVAARHLAERGYTVRAALSAIRPLKGDARLPPSVGAVGGGRVDRRRLADSDIVIDALFGAGLDRDVEGQPHAMIRAMNASAAPVIAVDLPSGINGTTAPSWGLRSARRRR